MHNPKCHERNKHIISMLWPPSVLLIVTLGLGGKSTGVQGQVLPAGRAVPTVAAVASTTAAAAVRHRRRVAATILMLKWRGGEGGGEPWPRQDRQPAVDPALASHTPSTRGLSVRLVVVGGNSDGGHRRAASCSPIPHRRPAAGGDGRGWWRTRLVGSRGYRPARAGAEQQLAGEPARRGGHCPDRPDRGGGRGGP